MSDLFRPIGVDQLAKWLFTELETRNSAFGIPKQHLFVPDPSAAYRAQVFGETLDTPFGPAAGPHSQMAQNIVAAWLCGARYVELKTVQTLDELEVSKPCIDMEDEGYNVEWSQELKVDQSFDEYLRAWVLIHALHHKLGFPGRDARGDLQSERGLRPRRDPASPTCSGSSTRMADARDALEIVDLVAPYYPAVRDIEIPDRISDNVTLSTMHGCPPEEIGKICHHLMSEWGLHTNVKLNPTLLGPERVRQIVNEQLGFDHIVVPDIAFEHDLKYADAIPMLREARLGRERDSGLDFGVKLSNTLEVENRPARVRPGREDDVPVRSPIARHHGQPRGRSCRGILRRPADVVLRPARVA